MVIAKKQRRAAGMSEAEKRMSPAAARESMPADEVLLSKILRLLKERDVPKHAAERILELHFSREGITIAQGERMIEYLDKCPTKLDLPFS